MNNIILLGKVNEAPTLKTLRTGEMQVKLKLSVTAFRQNKKMIKRNHNVEIRGRQAEVVANNVTIGTPVMIEGKLQVKGDRVSVRANRVQLLGD